MTIPDAGEASELVGWLEGRLELLQEFERRPSQAVPRSVITCGETERLLSLQIAMLVRLYPQIADEQVADMAESNLRPRH